MMAVLFALALIIRLACYTGLIASDDLGYSQFAQQIAHGTYRLEPHHYAIRYGVIVPVGVIYGLFGIHEWTTVILPLLSSALAPALLALLAWKLWGRGAAWIAGLLLATFPVDIRFASVLVPEPLFETMLLAGVLLFVFAEHRSSRILALLAGVVLAISYLTKEPGAFVVMALFGFAVLTRRWLLALWFAAGAALAVASEVVWYWSQSGDLLFRFHAMAIHNASGMAVAANENLSYRLWKAYPHMMLVPGLHFGLHSLLALGLAAVALWRRSVKILLLVLWAALPFLYLNFGTTSFKHYWALPEAPRYIALIYAPLFLMAAMVLAGWAATPMKRSAAAALVAIVCLLGVGCAFRTRGTGYQTEHVRRLREIIAATHQQGRQICEFTGPFDTAWRQVVVLLAPDQLGCNGSSPLQVVPDASGLPSIAQR